ncbi:MAG: hypothetical protein NTW87_18345 [Planctomycetota bacterium]|nr:hypothetical protein [Planctomycetota bacterium]
MKSFEMIARAVENVGVKKVAGDMKVSTSLVYKWCEEAGDDPDAAASGAVNPLDRVLALWRCTQDSDLLDWLCQRADGTFVPNLLRDRDIDAEYVERTQKLIQNFSRLLDVLSRSMLDDGRVDHQEAEDIRRQWQQLKQCGESFVAACERGVFDARDGAGAAR